MQFVRNFWYGAVWSKDLIEEPISRRILEEPIVLYRAEDGTPVALADACPHRFVPLHAGKIVDGGNIRCPYHGLEFNREGACVRNPHTNGRIPPAAKVRAYPLAERHGMVWIWMGSRKPDPDLIPDLSVLDNAPVEMISPREWLVMKTNYVFIVENLLDLSHVMTLHEGLLGNEDMAQAEISVREEAGDLIVSRTMRDVNPPELIDLLYKGNNARVDTWNDVYLKGISCLVNELGINDPGSNRTGGTGLRGVHILTPIDDVSSYYHFCAVRVNPPARTVEEDVVIRNRMSELRTMAFAEQDAPILAAQQKAFLDPSVNTSRPALFDIDAGAARFARRREKFLAADVD